MVFDIVAGRSKKDFEKYGTKGSVFIGKQYVQMGPVTSLSNNMFLDVASSHIVFVCGKRGGGKSYTMGVIAEGIIALPDEIRNNLSVIMLDTMGIYWTMKYPNNQDTELLQKWQLEPNGQPVRILTPEGFYGIYKEKGIPTDGAFTMRPCDLNPEDWCMTFSLDSNSQAGVLIARITSKLREKEFDIKELIDFVQKDDKADALTKNLVISHFQRVDGWGIFSKKGTALKELAIPGKVTVLDLSPYATLPNGWLIKSLVTGLVSKKLFNERMLARKNEEFQNIDTAMHYFSKEINEKLEEPLVWLVIDEAHELLPREGKTTATDALVTILREGRQPGISLVLASQQPGKIHTDVITQSDVVISHRLTAQMDVEALSQLTQTYMHEGIVQKLDMLPRTKGSAVMFDDLNEHVSAICIRPRFTWHGGGAPTAMISKPEFVFKGLI